MDEDDFTDALLEKFKRGPNDPKPEWAFKGTDGESILKEMDEIPLFMRGVPNNVEEIPAIAALQSLIYDGTPEGIVEYMK